MFSLQRLITKNVKPRYKLFDEDARRLTNRVGGFMIGSTFVLAIVVNQTGFELRDYPSMNWLTEFRTIRLQAAASVNHEREAVVVWSYLCVTAPLFFVYFLAFGGGISAASDRHLALCSLIFSGLAWLGISVTWGVGFFESVLERVPQTEPRAYLATRMRTTLIGMIVAASAFHFATMLSAVTVLRIWSNRLFHTS
jgi:hypothetical protein